MLAVYAMKTVSVDCPAVLIVSVYRQCCLCMRFVLSKPPPPPPLLKKLLVLAHKFAVIRELFPHVNQTRLLPVYPRHCASPLCFLHFPSFYPSASPHPTPPTSRASRSKPAV